jgi:AcrR family transcriptional regulator
MKETARKTGRPRTFDADTALDQALKVFWEKGYEGSSLPELTEAMGMNRPSLYAVFGNKENLFRLAMARYGALHDPILDAALAAHTARGVVEQFLCGNADAMTAEAMPHGCLLINGALACSDDALPLRKSAIERLGTGEVRLAERFERALAEADLPRDVSASQMARYVTTISNGMAVQAGAGATRAQLQDVVDLVLRSWPGK